MIAWRKRSVHIIANLSVLLGLVGGTALAALAGQAAFGQVPATPWFAMAHPLLFGAPHPASSRLRQAGSFKLQDRN